jgi:CheY-like chemotaxis protein
MDGRIWVESELGKGAAFIFEIQAKTGGAAQQAPEAQDGIAPSAEPLAGKRILVAEDVEINCEIIASLLEDTGIECVFAYNGAEAVEKFSAAPTDYDLILMDIHMPEMDGYEATKHIRASGLEGADSIPIIAATANTFPEDIAHCLDAGMNSHLGKPINPVLLIAELKKYLA